MRALTRLPLAAALIASSGAVVAIGAAPASALTCTDTYQAGGGSWTAAAHWSKGTLPSSTDVACWGAADTVTYDASQSSPTEADVAGVVGGTLVVSSFKGALNPTGSGSTLKGVTLTSGSLGGLSAPGGSVTVDGPVTINGGTESMGTFDQTSGTMTWTGSGAIKGGHLTSAGVVSMPGNLFFEGFDATHLGEADVQGLTMTGTNTGINTNPGFAGAITLHGPLTSPGTGTSSIASELDLADGASVTSSTIPLQLTEVEDVSTHTDRTITATAPGSIQISGKGHIATVTGSGTVTLTSGGALGNSVTNPLVIADLTPTTLNAGATCAQVTHSIDVTGTTTVGGTLTPPASNATFHDLTIHGYLGPCTNGLPTNQLPVGNATFTGNLDMSANGWSSALSLTQSGSGAVSLASSDVYGGLLTTTVPITVPDGASVYLTGPGDGTHKGSITAPGMTVGGNTAVGVGTTGGTLTLSGPLIKANDPSAGNNNAGIDVPLVLTSTGSVQLTGGTLNLAKGATLPAGSTFTTSSGTTLTGPSTATPIVNNGTATIGGAVSNGAVWDNEGGSLSLPATTQMALTNDGGTLHLPSAVGAVSVFSYTQGAGGTLPIRVSGDSTLDSIDVTTSTTPVVHGTIHVTDQGGYSPALGDDYDVVTCPSCNSNVLATDATVTDDLSGTVHYGVQGLARKLQLFVKGVPSAPAITAVDSITRSGARVTFTGSSANGSPVSSYVFTCSPACPGQGTTTVSPYTLTGLSPATAYSVTVHAVNGNGAGAESNAKTFSTIDVPQPPTGTLATPSDGQLTVTFTPPASNGGSAITLFTVTASCGGVDHKVNGSASPIVVSGLTDGVLCSVTVTASNAAGTSSASVIPSTATPDGPARPVVVTGTAPKPQTLQISFKQATGGAKTTSYVATCTQVGGSSKGTATGASSPLTITGLLNNTNYSCSVHGISAQGAGAESNAVIGRPGRLPTVTATITAGGKKVTKVKAGTRLTIKVVGTVADKPAIKRTVILIFQQSGKKTGKQVASKTTDSKGKATFTVTFTKAGSYEVQLPLGPSAPHSKLQTVKRAV